MKAILIKQNIIGEANGAPIVQEEIREIKPLRGKDFTLNEICHYIDCAWAEHLDLVKGVHLWVDEEGRLKDKPLVNLKATEYLNKAYPKDTHTYPGGVTDIVGNAIIVDNTAKGWL